MNIVFINSTPRIYYLRECIFMAMENQNATVKLEKDRINILIITVIFFQIMLNY